MIITGISISDSASDMERLAATVLQDYCQQMFSREVPLLSADDLETEADGTVLVGLPSTNPRIGNLVRARRVRNPERSLKPEGFVIETLIDGGLSTLVSGTQPTSCAPSVLPRTIS